MIGRRVPAVLQGSQVECAAACLAMVASYHGHHLQLREARELCGTGRAGASAGDLARAARVLGFTVQAYRTQPGILRHVPVPAIAHWGHDHYVVVERRRRGYAHLVDPNRGRLRFRLDQFDQQVGQVVLGLVPGPDFQHRPPQLPAFWRRYLGALLRLPGTGWRVTQVLFATLVVQLLGLAMPLLTGTLVDRVLPTGSTGTLALLAAGVAIVFAAQLVSGYLRAALIIYLQGRLDSHAMIGFCAHLLRLPLRYFQQRSTGDIVLRIASIALLRELLTTQTLVAVLDVLMILSYLTIMATLDVPVALLALAAVVTQAVLLVATMKLSRERMATELTAQAEAQGRIVETLEGITTVKASAVERTTVSSWSGLLLTWMHATLRRSHLTALLETAAAALRTLTPLLVLLLAIGRVIDGQLSVGTALALAWLAAAVVVPLSVLAGSAHRMQLAGAQLQRLADVLDAPPEQGQPSAPMGAASQAGNHRRDRRVRGRIELAHVTFRYERYGTAVLHDISTVIEPGARVAIVGPTGAGKTTLAMLLLGLYPVSEGTIRIDGCDVAHADLSALRSEAGTVLQESYVFAGTVHDNITFYDPTVSAAQVRWAASVAALDDDVMALPQGYQTRLSERGGGLSGGQRQRLALARAVVHQPALLILDEPTSHLDADTESVVNRNLSTLQCTQIIIAHRLSTVRDADQILVLYSGCLVEQGTHHELLARGERYATLVSAQLDGGRGPEPAGVPLTTAGRTTVAEDRRP